MYLHHDRSQRLVEQQNECHQSIQNYQFSIRTILKNFEIFNHTMYLYHDGSQRLVKQQNECHQSIQNYRFSIKTILKKFRKFSPYHVPASRSESTVDQATEWMSPITSELLI